MIKVNGYKNYVGGKSGSGTYQTIINHIPPHGEYYSLFLGNCGVTRHIRLANTCLLNDLDQNVIDAWKYSDFRKYHTQIITFAHQPALEILQALTKNCNTAADRFIYLDPPYRMSSRKSQVKVYRYEMNDSDHLDLLTQITAMSDHKIMISHYPDELYDMYLHGWHTHDFYSMKRNGMALERIYYNYDLSDGLLQDYSFIGCNFRERQTNARIKKNMLKKIEQMPTRLKLAVLDAIYEKFPGPPRI